MFITVQLLNTIDPNVIINTDKIDLLVPYVRYSDNNERYYSICVNRTWIEITEHSYIRLVDLLIDRH